MSDHFYYTLAPYDRSYNENAYEIDLNVSAHFGVLFKKDEKVLDEREFYLDRFEFIKNHADEFDLIANMLCEITSIEECSYSYLQCLKIYKDIVDGKYGKYPVDFFRGSNRKVQKIILYYLFQKNCNNKRQDYYENVLNSIFRKEVVFYYDKIKKILYVSFIAENTAENVNIEKLCRYFFADILLDINVKWNSYPVVIDKTGYLIASEGEQLCGTML